MWLFNLLFSTLSQLWYVEVRISRSVSVSPLEFEITRVDCISLRTCVMCVMSATPVALKEVVDWMPYFYCYPSNDNRMFMYSSSWKMEYPLLQRTMFFHTVTSVRLSTSEPLSAQQDSCRVRYRFKQNAHISYRGHVFPAVLKRPCLAIYVTEFIPSTFFKLIIFSHTSYMVSWFSTVFQATMPF